MNDLKQIKIHIRDDEVRNEYREKMAGDEHCCCLEPYEPMFDATMMSVCREVVRLRKEKEAADLHELYKRWMG